MLSYNLAVLLEVWTMITQMCHISAKNFILAAETAKFLRAKEVIMNVTE